MVAIIVAAAFDEGSVRKNSPRRAPSISANHQSTESISLDIVQDRVSRAINSECSIIRVIPATAIGKREVRWAEIGTVKDDNFVVVQDLHVHGRYADGFEQKLPPALTENQAAREKREED